MTSWITSLVLLLFVHASHAAGAIVVGAVVSQSGALAELAADYRKALLLWQDEINAAGGLLGRQVELRILDDRSEAQHAARLYRQLIEEARAELLLGPYGSASTLTAASVAEQARRVLINGAGAGRAVHRRAPRYVFQSTVPYAAYGEQAVRLAGSQGLRTLFIVARDDPASREMAEAALAAASREAMSVNAPEFYGVSSVDFAPQVQKARDAQAEAWIAFGEARDAAQMARAFKSLGYAPQLFFARGAADPKFAVLAGRDAERSVGAAVYDARLAPPDDRFVKAFRAKWSSEPGPSAGEGYAAATVLAAGVAEAKSLEQEKLRAALAALRADTILGGYRVDPANGAQLGARPVLMQIVAGRPRAVAPGVRLPPYLGK
jgi:branched-chain amino acid transport system substrate-binding protein